jgi:hypothetical protein
MGVTMNLDFGETFSRMWKIGWNHKVLWLFQMLPGLFSILLFPFFFIGNPGIAAFLPEPYNRLMSEPWMFVLSFIITFLLTIPIMVVATAAQSATTLGALKVENGAEKLSFRDLLVESRPYFWRMVGLYTAFGAAWMLIGSLIMGFGVGISLITLGLGSLCMMPLVLLLIPVVIVGYSVLELAQVALLAENRNLKDSIIKGWQTFRANVWAVLILMVILYFGFSTITSVFVFPMMFPMMFVPMFFIESSGDPGILFLVIFLVVFPIMMIFMFVIQGILMAFFQSAWVVAYRRLNGSHQNSPIVVEANA